MTITIYYLSQYLPPSPFSHGFFELVKTTKTSTVSSTVQLLSAPLSSKIDIDIISDLETKQTFD